MKNIDDDSPESVSEGIWPCGRVVRYYRRLEVLFECFEQWTLLPDALVRRLVRTYTWPGELVIVPLPGGLPGRALDAVDAMAEIAGQGRQAVAITADHERRESLEDYLACVRRPRSGGVAYVLHGDPHRPDNVLERSWPAPALIIQVLGEDELTIESFPQLARRLVAFRSALGPGGRLAVVTAPGRCCGSLVRMARQAGLGLRSRHLAVHTATGDEVEHARRINRLWRDPESSFMPLTVHAEARVFVKQAAQDG